MAGLRVRNGRLLLSRLGGLNYSSQERWDTAPERFGMWAFPFGLGDAFYYSHQWIDRLPKRLRRGTSPTDDTEEIEQQREAWLRQARHDHPLRHFWYAGDLYCHFAPTGEPLAIDRWTRMDALRYAEVVISAGTDRNWGRDDIGRLQRHRDSDLLEVFLPRRSRSSWRR